MSLSTRGCSASALAALKLNFGENANQNVKVKWVLLVMVYQFWWKNQSNEIWFGFFLLNFIDKPQ